jgi:hypothetical protein
MNVKWMIIILAALLLAGCAPAPQASSGDGIMRAVLFYTPGCSSCEKALRDILPPLESEFGARLQITRVPLNDLDEVGRLYESADYFKMKKDDVIVPFVVIGRDVLAGEAAVQRDLRAKIQAGLAAGGLSAPALPARLGELAARPTPTPRATLPPLIEIPGPGPANNPGGAAPCVINTPCPTTGPIP